MGHHRKNKQFFDTLDRTVLERITVFGLFNDLNDYATEHGIAQPYPTTQPFDKSNVIDRGKVADISSWHCMRRFLKQQI